MHYKKVHSFFKTQLGVVITLTNAQHLQIRFNEYSGKPYARKKVDTLLLGWVEHAGIYLGVDNSGTGWFAHNHTDGGTVVLSTLEEFSQEQKLYPYNIPCNKMPLEVIKDILTQAVEQRSYNWSEYNCQTSVSLACNNTTISKDADTGKIILASVAGLAIAGLGILAIKASK